MSTFSLLPSRADWHPKRVHKGKDAMLLGDFALEPSEIFNSIYLRTEFADCRFQRGVAQSFFVRFQKIIHHFEGLLLENVKTLIFENLLIVTNFASTGHICLCNLRKCFLKK